MVEGEARTSSSGDSFSGALAESKGANCHFRKIKNSLVIKNGADNNSNFIGLSLEIFNDSRESEGISLNFALV